MKKLIADTTNSPAKLKRGFAVMSEAKKTEIARKGGKAVSKNRRHMRDIGRIGGQNSHKGNGK